MISSFKYKVIALLLLSTTQIIQAKTVHIPLKIDFPLLHDLVIKQLFTDDSNSKEILQDPDGCSEIILSQPKLSESNYYLQLKTRVNAHLAIRVADNCAPLLDWDGFAQIISRPTVDAENNRVIYLQVLDSQLFDQDNKPIVSGVLGDKAKQYIYPFLKKFQYDLSPSIDELRQFLPLFLAKQPRTELNASLDSLHIGSIQVTQQGIASQLQFDIKTINQSTKREQVLNQQEQLQWEKKWQSMDALLTQTIKHFASGTQLKDLRLALFDILMNARYQLQNALQENQKDDSVRHWFINSWSKLIPLIQQISIENPQYSSATLMTLITASDALQALDKSGAAFGLDISTDGLRRLARLLNNTSDINPLNYDKKLDPELIQLFQFKVDDIKRNQVNHSFSPISLALAADDLSSNNWIPQSNNLDSYLLIIRKKLLEIASQTLEKSTLTAQHQSIFKKLVMATAWQESCWRQYVVSNNKIIPLHSSTGDTGIMQVNENIWRGFLNNQKLRWDIEYNIQAGSKILLDYMTRYAIKKNEHQYDGGIDNLARSTYSTYNGGPAQVARYRKSNIDKWHRKVDKSFYKKYLSVKQGNELAVAECLGGEIVTKPADKINTAQQVKSTKTSIHDAAWIKDQASNNFTIQLGVFSSHQSANNFIGKQKITGNYAIYKQHNKRKPLYTVIYGFYSKQSSANKEAKLFKKLTPWVRQFKGIKKLM